MTPFRSQGSPPTGGAVAVLIVTHDRPAALARALKSLATQTQQPARVWVLDNAGTSPVEIDPALPFEVTVARTAVKMGVAASRNLLIDACAAPLAFFLDDDAFLVQPFALASIAAHFAAHPGSAALAFSVHDHRTTPATWLRPRGTRSARAPVRVSYFIGGAHALRLDAVRASGCYDPSFFYGEEELDLSFRLIAAGHAIWYDPTLIAEHIPEGPRLVPRGRVAHHVRNRLVLARRYLPPVQGSVYGATWLVRYLFRAARHGDLQGWWQGARSGFREARHVPRTPLPDAARTYLNRYGGRLWF